MRLVADFPELQGTPAYGLAKRVPAHDGLSFEEWWEEAFAPLRSPEAQFPHFRELEDFVESIAWNAGIELSVEASLGEEFSGYGVEVPVVVLACFHTVDYSYESDEQLENSERAADILDELHELTGYLGQLPGETGFEGTHLFSTGLPEEEALRAFDSLPNFERRQRARFLLHALEGPVLLTTPWAAAFELAKGLPEPEENELEVYRRLNEFEVYRRLAASAASGSSSEEAELVREEAYFRHWLHDSELIPPMPPSFFSLSTV